MFARDTWKHTNRRTLFTPTKTPQNVCFSGNVTCNNLHKKLQKKLDIGFEMCYNTLCRCRYVGIGRRDGLKIRCQQWRVGSSPTIGTSSKPLVLLYERFFRCPFAAPTKTACCILCLSAREICTIFRSPDRKKTHATKCNIGMFPYFKRNTWRAQRDSNPRPTGS